MASRDGSPLSLDPEAMRRVGNRTIDMLVDRLTGDPGPVVRGAVTAVEQTRLLVLDWVLVNWLMKAASAFGEQLEEASRQRLATL
jgi:hypothetical protein